MGKTCIALLDNISKTQNEIIGMTILQAQMVIPNLTIIDFYKDSKLFKILAGEPDVIKTQQWNYNGWKDIYNHYVDIVKEFDNVIIFKSPTMRGYKNISDLDMIKGVDINVRRYDKYQMDYDLMRRNIERILFVRACRDKNVIHIILDPQEVDYSKVWKFNKYIRVGTIKRNVDIVGPIFEYAMMETYIQEIPKAQDLYFIASMYTKDRQYLKGYVDIINKKFGQRLRGGYNNVIKTGKRTKPSTGKVTLFDNDDLRDNRVSQSTYYYNLMLSNYTIIPKPYEEDSFNMVRFMEAVICDCVPLVLSDVNMQDLELTYPDIYDIIHKRDLLEDVEKINLRIREFDRDKKALMDIRTSKSFRRLTNKEQIEKFYKKVLR